MRTSIFNKPIFWIIFSVTSLIAAAAAYHLFPIAFPIVNLDLTMDRTDALSKAHNIAQQLEIGPKTYHNAAVFTSDSNTKNFIELEGGGATKLTEIIQQEYYAPYFWQVRHFNPQQKHETNIYFMPDGRPYGFRETIPDDMQLPSLATKEAQQLAEHQATTNWHIDFSKHTLVEHSKDKKPNGRVDHTFVYERTDKK